MSSLARIASGVAVGGTLVLYGLAAAILFRVSSGLGTLFPWWAAVAAPLSLYALIGFCCLRRVSAAGRLAGTGILCGIHTLLGLATAGLFGVLGSRPLGRALAQALWGYPLVCLLQLLWVSLAAFLFRSLVLSRGRDPGEPAAAVREDPECATPPVPDIGVTGSTPSPVRPAADSPVTISTQRGPREPLKLGARADAGGDVADVSEGELPSEPVAEELDPPSGALAATAFPVEVPALRPVPPPADLRGARKVAALLAPFGRLEVEARVLAGVSVSIISSPGLAGEAVCAATVRLLPFLADCQDLEPVHQVTLRGPRGAIVVTPLGPVDMGGLVLVAAIHSSGALALLEILALRAAAEYRTTHAGLSVATNAPAVEARRAPDLHDAMGPPQLDRLAGSLDAFGPVSPSTLCDAAGKRRLHLFLPPGTNTRRVGQFAADLCGALGTDGEPGGIGPYQSVVLRQGRERVIVWPVATRAQGSTLLVAGGGGMRRPGLAYLQVERAAAYLRSA